MYQKLAHLKRNRIHREREREAAHIEPITIGEHTSALRSAHWLCQNSALALRGKCFANQIRKIHIRQRARHFISQYYILYSIYIYIYGKTGRPWVCSVSCADGICSSQRDDDLAADQSTLKTSGLWMAGEDSSSVRWMCLFEAFIQPSIGSCLSPLSMMVACNHCVWWCSMHFAGYYIRF